MHVTDEPRDNGLPVNNAETRLRYLLRAAGFGEGVRGEQVRLNRALGTTTPDAIYRSEDHDPDEGVCIYLDGLSGQIHGDPETAEHDREIRAWLRNGGYDVIEITANELHDEGAMTRHFPQAGTIPGHEGHGAPVARRPLLVSRAGGVGGGPTQPVALGDAGSRRPLRDLRAPDPAAHRRRRIRESRYLCRGIGWGVG